LNITGGKWKIGLAAAVAVAAAAWLWSNHSGEAEPSYGGRRLGEWLIRYAKAKSNSAPGKEAEDAIRKIGTNGLPFALEWMRNEPAPWRVKLNGLLKKLPGHLRLNDRRDDLGDLTSKHWFKLLGPQAEPAIPQLILLLRTTKSPDSQYRAVYALGTIGDAVVPPLLAVLAQGGSHDRKLALQSLWSASPGTNAFEAVSTVIGCLDDPDWFVANCAAGTLGRWVIEPEATVPALVGCLKKPHWLLRQTAANSLGNFGQAARPAVPDIVFLLNDSQAVRVAATNALARIAPDELRKAQSANRQ
jgi:HEAT repeat protein